MSFSGQKWWVLGFVLGLGAFGCASGPRFDGTEYRDDRVSFRLGTSTGHLRRLESNDALLVFLDESSGATWAINARCRLDGDDVPLQALVQHLFLQFTERKVIGEKHFVLDGREALEVEMIARMDGVRRHFVVTVLKKDGCVYDFVHVDGGGTSPELEASRASFRGLVRGFRTL